MNTPKHHENDYVINHEIRIHLVEDSIKKIEKRFDQVDKNFETFQKQIDKKFDKVYEDFKISLSEIKTLRADTKHQFYFLLSTMFGGFSSLLGLMLHFHKLV